MKNEKVKEWKIGSYVITINNEDAGNEKHPYSAAIYKGTKLISKFRSASPIEEDQAFYFFFVDQRRDKGASSLNYE